VRQRRRREGKTVAKRLSATMLKEENQVESSEPRGGRTSVPVARIGSPLLLKTNLPRPPRHPKVATGRI
jgi:hypothetical protein